MLWMFKYDYYKRKCNICCDMAKVVMLNTYNPVDVDNSLSSSELEWQEKRNKRKVRKLDFEDRSLDRT